MTREPSVPIDDQNEPEEGTLPGEVTQILQELGSGRREALNEVMPLVYRQLWQKARLYLRGQSPGHTLQPTALINEVYLKLSESSQLSFENRAQFFWFAGLLMRRILIDYARSRQSLKRGGGDVLMSFDESRELLGQEDLDLATLLALDALLDKLAVMDARQSQIVQLRFFAGMSLDEISEIMSISRATIKREWRTARMWLARELSAGQGPVRGP